MWFIPNLLKLGRWVFPISARKLLELLTVNWDYYVIKNLRSFASAQTGQVENKIKGFIPWLTLLWRHNGRDGVSNHQPHDCLLKRSSRRRSKKTSKLRVTGLCAGNSLVSGEFPAQRPVTRKMFLSDVVIMSQAAIFYFKVVGVPSINQF